MIAFAAISIPPAFQLALVHGTATTVARHQDVSNYQVLRQPYLTKKVLSISGSEKISVQSAETPAVIS